MGAYDQRKSGWAVFGGYPIRTLYCTSFSIFLECADSLHSPFVMCDVDCVIRGWDTTVITIQITVVSCAGSV